MFGMDKIASLLVPFSGEGKLLRQFFECLKKSHDILKYEIILIGDGCSNHDTIEYAKQLYRHHSVDHLLLFNQSLGFGVANNEGVKRSTTNRLVFINDDIILINHEIDLLLQEQQKNNCAAIQPVLLYPQTNTVQSTGHIFGVQFNRHAQQGRKFTELRMNSLIERQAITLSFCAINKSVFSSFGGFDPFYYNAYEGLELTHRIHSSNLGCKVSTSVVAYHIQSSTRNKYARSEEQYRPYFWIRNHATIREDLSSEWEKMIPTDVLRQAFLEINFSPLKMEQSVKKVGFITREIINLPLNGEINLFTALPFDFIQIPLPLLILCDNFTQLQKNSLWGTLRNRKDDIVLDSCGNVVSLAKIVF